MNHKQDPIRSHFTLYLCCTLVKKHAPRWIRQGNSAIEVHLVVKNNEIITTGLNSSLANELAITQNAIDRFSKVENKIKKNKTKQIDHFLVILPVWADNLSSSPNKRYYIGSTNVYERNWIKSRNWIEDQFWISFLVDRSIWIWFQRWMCLAHGTLYANRSSFLWILLF